MRKEDFFEILGELDDTIVIRAGKSMKKTNRINWKALGIAAACLILTGSAAVHIFYPDHRRSGITEQDAANREQSADDTGQSAADITQCSADIAPMVYVNDTLYKQSADQRGYTEWNEEFIYLGEIESMVSSESEPGENFQANDPIIGCKVYQYGENLVVQINDAYWLYIKYERPQVNWDELSEQEKLEMDPNYFGP